MLSMRRHRNGLKDCRLDDMLFVKEDCHMAILFIDILENIYSFMAILCCLYDSGTLQMTTRIQMCYKIYINTMCMMCSFMHFCDWLVQIDCTL